MAGEWLKMRVWIAKDPKVIAMTDYLAGERCFCDWLTDPVRQTVENAYDHNTSYVLRSVTVTALLQVWGVGNELGRREGNDILLPHGSLETLDEIAGIPKFGAAMASVGWAIEEEVEGGWSIRFPNFLENNVPASERPARKSNAQKQKEYRERKKAKGQIAPEIKDTNGVVTKLPNVTLEKRREEKSNTTPSFSPVAQEIVDYYQRVVNPDHPKARGTKNVTTLLNKGLTKEQLMVAADGYAAFCSRKQPDRKFRMAVGNFYGQAAGYEEYLGAPVSTDYASMSADDIWAAVKTMTIESRKDILDTLPRDLWSQVQDARRREDGFI